MSETQASSEPTNPKFSCQNLWKIFGPNPKSLLVRHDYAPSADHLAEGGYVGAVRDVSFEVHAGEILVFMGLSGSGKSTLIRCLSRLIDPTAGHVLFEGRDLLAASDRELIDLRRHKMAMVFQNFGLVPHRTVLENVALPLEIRGIARDKRSRQAREQIRLVGLEGREKYYPRELSGGQQQRVGIARSLVTEPEVWLLDEPFSALDPLIRREMQTEFLRLQAALQKTIIFITHDFDEAVRLADRIAIMKDGQVIQLDTAEALVMNPNDDYVAQFTRDAPRGRILTAAAIMDAPDETTNTSNDHGISAEAYLDDIAPVVLSRDAPVSVIRAGKPIGTLSRARVLDALFKTREQV